MYSQMQLPASAVVTGTSMSHLNDCTHVPRNIEYANNPITKYDIRELHASTSVHVNNFSSYSVLSLDNSGSLPTQPSVHDALQSPAKQLHVLDFLQEILLCNFSTSVHSSVFGTDLTVLRHALALHGLPSFDMTVRQCCITLLHHLFTGACSGYNFDIRILNEDLTALLAVVLPRALCQPNSFQRQLSTLHCLWMPKP